MKNEHMHDSASNPATVAIVANGGWVRARDWQRPRTQWWLRWGVGLFAVALAVGLWGFVLGEWSWNGKTVYAFLGVLLALLAADAVAWFQTWRAYRSECPEEVETMKESRNRDPRNLY